MTERWPVAVIDGHVKEAARRWVPGAGPPQIDLLHDGLVNRSFRVRRAGHECVLRMPVRTGTTGISALASNLDRRWELRVLRAASAARIAPAVLACEPESGILVTAWIDGQAWSAAQAVQADSQPIVGRLLRRVHELAPEGPVRHMTVGDWCGVYRQALKAPGLPGADPVAIERTEAGVSAALEAYSRLPPVSVRLCHSDLHRLNLLQSEGQPWLVDWEYAHVGDPFWDLAGWVRSTNLAEQACEILVSAYLGRPPLPIERARLQCLFQIHDFICLLWNMLVHP